MTSSGWTFLSIQAKPQDFDALLLHGGLVNLDALRVQPKAAMAFTKAFFGRPASQWRRSAAAHGPSLRINAARGEADDLVLLHSRTRSQERWSGTGCWIRRSLSTANLVTGRTVPATFLHSIEK